MHYTSLWPRFKPTGGYTQRLCAAKSIFLIINRVLVILVSECITNNHNSLSMY